MAFQHTAARRRLPANSSVAPTRSVSTHSRPKAAALRLRAARMVGWFQHTAARRRLLHRSGGNVFIGMVSTHSRPKAAVCAFFGVLVSMTVSTHSRPKAAARSTGHNRPSRVFQHTAARRRLVTADSSYQSHAVFQHTAARRRLTITIRRTKTRGSFNTQPPEGGWIAYDFLRLASNVSTHSRPKAAGARFLALISSRKFQHTAARRRLVALAQSARLPGQFQHTAARRRLGPQSF